jgi:alkylation response protein AidB-like acyl-CoA dehydrogenase
MATTESPAEIEELRADLHAWLSAHAGELKRFETLPNDLDGQFALLGDLQRLLYEAGWLRWGWPVEVGGLGGSSVLRGVVIEELTVAGIPPPFSFGLQEVLAPAVVKFGPPALVAEVLPALLRGDEGWCQGFSEPQAGSDLGSLRLRATAVDDGFVVSGQKVWTSWAQYADRCLLLGRTGAVAEAHRGITAFLVDMHQPGITVRTLRAMSGDGEFAEMFFDDVFVPATRVIGTVGGGWAVTMYVLSCERGAIAWQRQAWMHRRLQDLLRSLDGGSEPSGRIGQVYSNLYALRLLSRRTLEALAGGASAGPWSSVDKLMMSTAEQALFDAALDLLPATLVATDDDPARAWRSDYFYSRAASIYGGAADIQRNIIGERLLGLPRSG